MAPRRCLGAVDLSNLDDVHRNAVLSQIQLVGQSPDQLWKERKHPQRSSSAALNTVPLTPLLVALAAGHLFVLEERGSRIHVLSPETGMSSQVKSRARRPNLTSLLFTSLHIPPNLTRPRPPAHSPRGGGGIAGAGEAILLPPWNAKAPLDAKGAVDHANAAGCLSG